MAKSREYYSDIILKKTFRERMSFQHEDTKDNCLETLFYDQIRHRGIKLTFSLVSNGRIKSNDSFKTHTTNR